jgi:nitrogen fixation protein
MKKSIIRKIVKVQITDSAGNRCTLHGEAANSWNIAITSLAESARLQGLSFPDLPWLVDICPDVISILH